VRKKEKKIAVQTRAHWRPDHKV